MNNINILFIIKDQYDINYILNYIDELGYSYSYTITYYKDTKNEIYKSQWDIIFAEYNEKELRSVFEGIRVCNIHVPIISLNESMTVEKAFSLGSLGFDGYISKADINTLKIIEREFNQFKVQKVDNYLYNSLFTTLSSIADGVISTNNKGIITFINEAAEKIIGTNRCEAINEQLNKVMKLVNNKTNEKIYIPFEEVVNSKSSRGLLNNTVLIAEGGEKKLLSANISPIKNGKDNVSGIVIVFRNITRFKKIEEQLREEKNNLVNTFKHMPVGMAIIGNNERVEEINTAFLSMMKRNKDQVVGRYLGDILYCEKSIDSGCGNDIACVNCRLRKGIIKVIYNKANVQLIKTICSNNKTNCNYYRISLVSVNVSSQDKVLLAIEDITEDKRKELNLKESRDFYLSLFDNLPALIMTLDINMQGDYFNKKYLEFTGFSSKNIEKIDWAKAIHPSDYKRYNDLFIERFKKHKVLYLEHRMKRYDGEYRWMSSRANPYYDIDGVFGGYIVSAYDITDEKEAVQKLEESEKKYKKLFMNMLNGFCYHKVVFDEMGKIVDFILLECNDAYLELTGLCEHEIVGRRFTEVFDELYNSSFDWINTLGSVELTGEIVNFEVNVFNEDSLWINVLAYSTEKGYIAVLVSDITMKKRTEIEKQKTMKIVKEAYRTKSEFLANMSHEIRTPLNGIIGMIDLTMLTNLDEEQEDNLNTAKNCADSLLHIINDILDFSKLEAGKMKLANKEFNINELINKISRIHSYKAKEKYLNFSSKIQEDMPNIVIGDANRLQQVLNNLISNAIKFTDKGSVNIFLSVVDKTNKNIKVRFEVIDTGIGISKEEMNKLFVSFSQVDGSRTRTYGGTGLGLVISKQIIEMAGGSIDVISEKGRGSTFFFDFQFDLPVNENKQDNIINEENLLSNYSANILVVEDDRINQFVISKQLKKLGHTCTIVNNGIEAIEMLKKRYYDLCLMDIQMPVLDGIDTTTIIRKNEEKTDRYLPIIALTAHALAGDREKFLNIGMDEYLSKPCQIKNLFNVTEKILNKFKKSSITQEILNANKNKEIESYNILIKNIKKNIAFLEENILNEDISEIESTSHNLKDIAEKLNLNDIKVLSFRIELAARKKDMIEVLELKNELTLKTKVYIENI